MPGKSRDEAIDNDRHARRTKRFRQIFVAIYIAMAPLLILLAMEICVRWRLVTVESRNSLIQSSLRNHAHLIEATDQSLWTPSHDRYRRNARIELDIGGELIVVSTNDHGFRGDDLEVPKPPGRFRIVCLGGSTTVEGPTNELTYPAILQQKLRDHYGHERIEVVNCGISGLCAVDEVALLSSIFELDPDWIIEYNGVNDLCWRIIPELYQTAPSWRQLLRNSRLVARKWDGLISADPTETDSLWHQYTFPHLHTMREMCRERKVRLLLSSFCYPDPNRFSPEQREYFDYNLRHFWGCPWTSYEEYCRMIDAYNDSLRTWCEAEGVTCLPTQETMAGLPEHYVDICHMTPSGINAKADAVFVQIRDEIELTP